MRKLRFCLILTIMTLGACSTFAWTPKEYALLTRQAALDLIADPLTPSSMRLWLTAGLSQSLEDAGKTEDFFLREHVGPFAAGLQGIAYWSAVPDLIAATDAGRNEIVEPFGVPERALHYLDLERLNARPQEQRFSANLANKPPFSAIPRAMHDPRYLDAGMLPFRAEQCRQRMVDAIVAGRLLPQEGQLPRDEHALRWAGYLAHYLADGWEPQHATSDYSFAWALGGRRDLGDALRQAFEVRLCDSDIDEALDLRREYWAALVAARQQVNKASLPIVAKDTWEASVEALRYSYDFLPLIGHAAAASLDSATGRIDLPLFYHHRDATPVQSGTLLESRARLQALAIAQIRLEWLRAWEEAQRLRQIADPMEQWRTLQP